jgi:hypothetical protein
LFEALVGDGRPLLKLTGIALIGSALQSIAETRVVKFMINDRV